jgi:hypothetical protein
VQLEPDGGLLELSMGPHAAVLTLPDLAPSPSAPAFEQGEARRLFVRDWELARREWSLWELSELRDLEGYDTIGLNDATVAAPLLLSVLNTSPGGGSIYVGVDGAEGAVCMTDDAGTWFAALMPMRRPADAAH